MNSAESVKLVADLMFESSADLPSRVIYITTPDFLRNPKCLQSFFFFKQCLTMHLTYFSSR